MTANARHIAWLFIIVGGMLYGLSRALAPGEHLHSSVWETGPSPETLQAILAGPDRGVMADLDVLSVFSLYEDIKNQFTDKQQIHKAWEFLASYLERSQAMDPLFQDPYRLAGGMLGYTEGFQLRAVDILERGAEVNPKNWQYPFFAGFIAHDQLHDDKLAYQLMTMALQRPGVPPLVLGVTAQLLAKDKGPEASLRFLELMQQMMPLGYRGPIQNRIQKLKKEFHLEGVSSAN